MRNKIFCLIGPSGTGKDTIKNILADRIPHIVSYRTREMRPGEVDGVDGHFISVEEFIEMDKQDMWIASTNYAGNFYGITQGELLPLEDRPLLYVVDWQGVVTLREALDKIVGYSSDDVVTIFLDSNREEVYKRMILQGRSTNEISKRLQQYDEDMLVKDQCDHIIRNCNGSIERTADLVLEVIMFEQVGKELFAECRKMYLNS